MVKIPNIPSKVRGGDIEGDWVTSGVVVDKLPPKDSAKGSKFVVWKLSDLSSQSAVVTLFLFGKAYQEHWKLPQGQVVALLNPSIMPNKEVSWREGALVGGKTSCELEEKNDKINSKYNLISTQYKQTIFRKAKLHPLPLSLSPHPPSFPPTVPDWCSGHSQWVSGPLPGRATEADGSRCVPRLHHLPGTHQSRSQVH